VVSRRKASTCSAGTVSRISTEMSGASRRKLRSSSGNTLQTAVTDDSNEMTREPASPSPTRGFPHSLIQLFGCPWPGLENLTRGGEPYPPVAPLHELHTQLLFQLPDLMTECRLRDVQQQSSLCEVVRLGPKSIAGSEVPSRSIIAEGDWVLASE
jgi:hypothetical protein